MSRKPKDSRKVWFEASKIMDATTHLMSVSEVLTAIYHDYSRNGQMNAGALVHCRNTINTVIENLGLDELAIKQDKLDL